jgi:hypothetical protein
MDRRDINALVKAIRGKNLVMNQEDEKFISKIEGEILAGNKTWTLTEGNRVLLLYRRAYQGSI